MISALPEMKDAKMAGPMEQVVAVQGKSGSLDDPLIGR
jgi:hypothetical protein